MLHIKFLDHYEGKYFKHTKHAKVFILQDLQRMRQSPSFYSCVSFLGAVLLRLMLSIVPNLFTFYMI